GRGNIECDGHHLVIRRPECIGACSQVRDSDWRAGRGDDDLAVAGLNPALADTWGRSAIGPAAAAAARALAAAGCTNTSQAAAPAVEAAAAARPVVKWCVNQSTATTSE